MQKIIILTSILLCVAYSCKKEDIESEIIYREIAWNHISEWEKTTVNIKWSEAPVFATDYQGKKAIAVQFNTTMDALLGPILVFIDVDSKKVLGTGIRE